MHIRGLPFGFSFTRMFESQSVDCMSGLMMPSSQSLFNLSFTLSNFDMGTNNLIRCVLIGWLAGSLHGTEVLVVDKVHFRPFVITFIVDLFC